MWEQCHRLVDHLALKWYIDGLKVVSVVGVYETNTRVSDNMSMQPTVIQDISSTVIYIHARMLSLSSCTLTLVLILQCLTILQRLSKRNHGFMVLNAIVLTKQHTICPETLQSLHISKLTTQKKIKNRINYENC